LPLAPDTPPFDRPSSTKCSNARARTSQAQVLEPNTEAYMYRSGGNVEQVTPMEYVERGGLRWGKSFLVGANASWPFAKLVATPTSIVIFVRIAGITVRSFELAASDVASIRPRRGWLPFSVGIEIEHSRSDYPPVMIFWTYKAETAIGAIAGLGYPVADDPGE
jgi:hypothetical protein